MLGSSLLAALVGVSAVSGLAVRQDATTPKWLELPDTPALPSPVSDTLYDVNGIKMWVQKYNEKAGVTPLVMDHGGLGYSAYFGSVIQKLVDAGHYIIALDRRGHGRSTFNADDVFTYVQMADDIHKVLAQLQVNKYNVVGWSDGGITTLQALIDPVTAAPIEKAFVFGASISPDQTNPDFSNTDIYDKFVKRCLEEYGVLHPNVDFYLFGGKVQTMETELPNFTSDQLASIDGSKLLIVGADHEEAVNQGVPEVIRKAIPGSTVKMLTGVSHFAPLQDPQQFTDAIVEWFY
ncbi:Valacyclovir hydrolase [Ceratocystis lukuohia]